MREGDPRLRGDDNKKEPGMTGKKEVVKNFNHLACRAIWQAAIAKFQIGQTFTLSRAFL